MARLALGLAGAALGSYTGIGANTGYLIGSAIGGFLFPDPPVVTEGPRLGDLSISASTYGAAIPIGFGTLRMGGNLIWASSLREVRTEEEVGGGKGSPPSQVQVTYTYFADIAYAFAEGPAKQMLRLWFDNKLVSDIRPPSGGLAAGVQIGPTTAGGINRTFYPGNETQLPDPTIEALEGVGSVPAHRGLVYVVFNNLNVTEYGNRIPQCTAEIAFDSLSANSGRLAVQNTGVGITGHQTTALAFDSSRRIAYMRGASGGPGLDGIRVVNVDTLTEVRQQLETVVAPSNSISDGNEWTVDSDGFLYINFGSTNGRPIVKIDPNTLTETARFGSNSGSTSNGEFGFGALAKAMIVEVINPIPDPTSISGGGRRKFHVSATIFDDIGIFDAETMLYVHDEANTGFLNVAGMVAVPAENAGIGLGTGWFASQNGGNNDIRIYKVEIDATAGATSGVGFGASITLAATLTNSTWNADGSSTEVKGPILDRTDGGLIFIKEAQSFVGVHVFKWLEGAGIIWTGTSTTQGPNLGASIANNSIVENSVFGWTNVGELAVLIDTTDGTILEQQIDLSSLTSPTTVLNGQMFFDSETQSVIAVGGTTAIFLGQYFLGRESGLGENLGTIISDISGRVGLVPGDIGVAELVDTVRGYGITRQMTARAAVNPLSTAFLFDGVESDDKVDFKKRGRDPTRTITEQNMLVVKDDTHDVIGETRTQEVELPERISIAYMDIDTDYQQGTQSVKRIKSPSPTMRSSNEQTIQMPIVFNASEAEQLAEQLLFTAWNERTSYQFLLPWENLDLDPADVIDLSITRNAVTTNLRARLTKATANLDLTVSVEALSEDKITVESTAVADGAQGVPQQQVPGPTITQLFVFDIPLLRDFDDGGIVSARLYYAMDGYRANWPGGALYDSPDGFTFTNTSLKSTVPVAHGVVTSLVPDTSTPFLIDSTTQITLILEEGSLSSVTETAFLNDASVCLIGNIITGEFEIINFRDVSLSGGVYTLSNLMRGRRGTEVWTGNHAIGDKFFFLQSPNVSGFLELLADLNSTTFYRAVGFGGNIEQASTKSFLPIGRSQMPYAPVHLDALPNVSDNIDLSWIRRNRIAGELRSGTGTVPMSEDTEQYELEILASPGGAILRTVLALTTPTYEYTKSNLITDIGIGTGTTTLDVSSTTEFSRAAGSFITDGFKIGDTIETTGFTAGANNSVFVIITVGATLLEVDVSTLVVESGGGNELIDTIREDDITFKVYQISGQVGRGFGGEDTIIL